MNGRASPTTSDSAVAAFADFARRGVHLVQRCEKPDRAEFFRTAAATGAGFLIVGFIGFVIKLIHIPINNVLVGGE